MVARGRGEKLLGEIQQRRGRKTGFALRSASVRLAVPHASGAPCAATRGAGWQPLPLVSFHSRPVFPNASASHPPSRHTPPSGVMAPSHFRFVSASV